MTKVFGGVLLLTFIIFSLTSILASTEAGATPSPKEMLAEKNWHIGYGFASRRVKHFRGALIHDGTSYLPLLSYRYKNLSFRGPQIIYTIGHPRKTHSELGIRYFDDNPPFLPDVAESYTNSRTSAIDVHYKYTHQSSYWKWGLKLSYNLDRYKEFYAEASVAYKVHPLLQLTYHLDMGQKNANVYAYGTGASGGSSHHYYGIRAFLPFVPYKGIAFINFEKHELLKHENKRASLVDQQEAFWNLFIMLLWRI